MPRAVPESQTALTEVAPHTTGSPDLNDSVAICPDETAETSSLRADEAWERLNPAEAAAWLAHRLGLPADGAAALRLSQGLDRDALDGLRALRDTTPALRRIVLRGWLGSLGGSAGAETSAKADEAALHRLGGLLDAALTGNGADENENENENENEDEDEDDDGAVNIAAGASAASVPASPEAAPSVSHSDVPQEDPSPVPRSRMVCSAAVLLVAAYAAGIILAVLMEDHCKAHPAEVMHHGRTWTEAAIGGAPIWARNTCLATMVTKTVFKASGFRDSAGLARTLLVAGSEAAGEADAAGWVAIVGGGAAGGAGAAQSSWEEARQALRLTPRQAIAMGIAKLLLWHWSQPLAYLWVFLGVYFCELDHMQQGLGSLVAVREIVYMLTTILAAKYCPAYLLLDVGTVWNEAETRLERGTCIAAYILTPHNYVALCLANRFRSAKAKMFFMLLAFGQVVCDFVSCFALVMVLKYIGDASAAPTSFDIPIALNLTGDSASQTGHFATSASGGASGEWTLNGDELELSWSGWDGLLQQRRGAPVALALGYGITAASFVLFFGPALVASLLADAIDEGKGKGERVAKGFFGGAMGIGLAYLLLLFIMLLVGVDIWCGGWVGSYPCSSSDLVDGCICSRGMYECRTDGDLFGEQCDIKYAESYALSGCSDPDHCGVFRRVDARCTSGEDCPGGVYERSGNLDPALCDGAPVYQRGGGDGPVLHRVGDGDGSTQWEVGDSSALEDCSSDSDFLGSARSYQPGGGLPTDPAYSAGGGWSDSDAGPTCTSDCGIAVAAGGRYM